MSFDGSQWTIRELKWFMVHSSCIYALLYFQFIIQMRSNDINDSKRTKSLPEDDEEQVANLVCTSRFNYEHLLNISWLNDLELVAVGVNPITMIAQLPFSLKEKRFGVS